MKIEHLLNEDLGNLSQLNAGPLINLLKQEGGIGVNKSSSKWSGVDIGGDKNKFTSYGSIGSTSEIIDGGQIKSFADVRKLFKQNDKAKAIALYIGGKAVMLLVTEGDMLAGATRHSKIAFDLSSFEPQIKALKDQHNAEYKGKWDAPLEPFAGGVTSAHTKKERQYNRDWSLSKEIDVHYTGVTKDTSTISVIVSDILKIAGFVQQPVTAKLVTTDMTARTKRQERSKLTPTEIYTGRTALMNRLKLFKNSKKPTAKTIQEFIDMVVKKGIKQVQFGGDTYSGVAQNYYGEGVDPQGLLLGKPFKVRYQSLNPNSYDSLDLSLRYDPKTMMVVPYFATWYDRSDPANPHTKQEAILDTGEWLAVQLGNNWDNKAVALKKILQAFQDGRYKEVAGYIQAYEKLGVDWPEFATIKKSLAIELNKQQKKT